MSRSPARELAFTALRRWHQTREFADRIIQDLLAATTAPAPERAFAQELFYGVLRNLTLLDYYIARLREAPVDALSRDLIRLGIFQLFHLQTPTHAALFETVELAPRGRRSLVNAILRNAVRSRERLLLQSAGEPLYIRESHPRFLISRWTAAFGHASTSALCHWNNQPAPIYARINTAITDLRDFLARNLSAHPVPECPVFVKCDLLPRLPLARGQCYIQDPSTALAVNLLDVRPGEKILDACAAPGGKVFQIADATAGKASIFACDRDDRRLDLMRENLRRLGYAGVRVLQHDWLIDSGPVPSELNEFDKILIDAPCTNTGVMRRRVDVRWRLRPADFNMMADQQFRIVASVLPLLRDNGVLVYSTCSLEHEENQGMVERLSREFPALASEQIGSMLPFEHHFDGAFAARFVLRG